VPFSGIELILPRISDLAPQGEVPAVAASGKPKCPECGGDLVTVKSGEIRGAAARTCLVCFGRWIDGGELAKLRKGGLFSRLLRLFGFRPEKRAPAAEGPAPFSAEESARTEAQNPEESGTD
jgi:Zn-finger nucleic acid-binding protein